MSTSTKAASILMKIHIFEKGILVMHGYIRLHGGDINENDNFKVWKLIIHGYKKLHGGDLNDLNEIENSIMK